MLEEHLCFRVRRYHTYPHERPTVVNLVRIDSFKGCLLEYRTTVRVLSPALSVRDTNMVLRTGPYRKVQI